MKKRVLVWECIGIGFIIVLGTILHFVFEWTNYWKPIAIFAAVNESVWEHLKLGFWPSVFFSILEYFFIKKYTNNFFIAKAVNLHLIPLSIITLYYLYTFVLGKNLLVLDILVFIISVVIGQCVSFKILTVCKLPRQLGAILVISTLILIILFVVFTFYPPKLMIFKDPVTGEYGI